MINKWLRCLKTVNMLDSKIMKGKKIPFSDWCRFWNKNYETKKKKLFLIYVDFESIWDREDNGKQNPEECCTNKYQKHIACNYSYKLVCADDKFSKPYRWRCGLQFC